VSGFSATTAIARSDFGLKRAIPLISDEIQITIEAELLRKE
jgi:polyisoprenoid-binding protein YceI